MLQAVANYPILFGMAFCLAIAGIFHETQRWLLPMRIPAGEIATLADQLIEDFGWQAAETAVDEQGRARFRSEPFEEGKWWRVERAIRRKQSQVRF